jgi:hypothetical protein
MPIISGYTECPGTFSSRGWLSLQILQNDNQLIKKELISPLPGDAAL